MFKVRKCNSVISDVAWMINVTQVINEIGYFMIQILMGITLSSNSNFTCYAMFSELCVFHDEKNLWHNKALKWHPVYSCLFLDKSLYTTCRTAQCNLHPIFPEIWPPCDTLIQLANSNDYNMVHVREGIHGGVKWVETYVLVCIYMFKPKNIR